MPDILIVNDDMAARETVAEQLNKAGYRTSTAGTVPEAMHILMDRQPDLLITEVRVSGYNGLHLIAMAPHPLPAIVITAYHDSAIEADARRLGAAYQCAPLSFERLRVVIEETLRTARELGVFLPARTEPRSVLPVPVPIMAGDAVARILDVSAGGARLEVQHRGNRPLRASLKLRLDSTVIPVDVAWQRRQSPLTIMCGVSVDPDRRPAWASVLSSHADLRLAQPA